MKKFAAVVAVAVLFAFAAPVFAATNPFMDVPMNHWAYDAIGQLAAHGILSGYPDGTYKGKQPTTRYEMASALARALAVVDMTKASKQDVEMLKKLVVEFKDELDALGVKVDGLDKRVSIIEERLGGWHIHGSLRMDITNVDNDSPDPDNLVKLTRARLFFEREFGDEENPMKFVARVEPGEDDLGARTGRLGFTRFYAEIPFYWETTLTVGRFNWDLEDAYYLGGETDIFGIMEGGLDSVLTDRTLDAFGITKTFGLGEFHAYVAHKGNIPGNLTYVHERSETERFPVSAWDLMAMAKLQFTEQFGLDLGLHAWIGDNAEFVKAATDGWRFNHLWTLFGGLRFDFNENIGLKGIYYHQNYDTEVLNAAGLWVDALADDDYNAWKFIVDVKQDALKFTSLWLEYAHYEQGFHVLTGSDTLFHSGWDSGYMNVPFDLNVWRIGARQEWNEKWATFLFVAGYKFDEGARLAPQLFRDAKALEWGLGVTYQYNPNVVFGLQYTKIDWNDDAELDITTMPYADEHVFRFRTQVTF